MFEAIAIFAIAFLANLVGSSLLEKGATAMSIILKVSAVVSAMIFLAIGSSFAELCLVIVSIMQGVFSVGLGGIFGSAIFNIVAILALSRMVHKGDMAVSEDVGRHYVFYLVTAVAAPAILFWLLPGQPADIGTSVEVTWWMAAPFLLSYFAFTWYETIRGKQNCDETSEEDPGMGFWGALSRIVLGMALIGVSTHFLVESAIMIFGSLGLTELGIGVLIMAPVTSIADAVVSMISAMRKNVEGAMVNAIDSNLFDYKVCLMGAITVVGGITIVIDTGTWYLLGGLVFFSVIMGFFLWTKRSFSLIEAVSAIALLLIYYVPFAMGIF